MSFWYGNGGGLTYVTGLDPSGNTDVTALIQAAINLAPADSGGFTYLTDYRGLVVQLPPGRFLVTSTLTLRPGVTLQGAGKQATVLVNGSASGDVISFTGADAGTIDCLGLNNLAVVQKSGVTHTSGCAINIDGGGFGCTIVMDQVATYGTYMGTRFRDVYLSNIESCEAYLHTTNGFLADSLCTSINFTACYAAANTSSGYKIFGNYLTMQGCGADSNGSHGYEFYYNSGSAVSIAMVGCGAEGNSGNGISADRVSGLTIGSPRIIAPNGSANAGIKLDGGAGVVIDAPVISSLQANAAAAISLVNTSGSYTVGTTITAFSAATNYATLVDQVDRVFHILDQTQMGLGAKGFRLGPTTSYTADLQSVFIGSTPASSGGIAYGLHARPQASGTITTFACLKSQPEVQTADITRVIGHWASSPINTGASPQRAEGIRIDDIAGGFGSNVNLGIGATVAVSGSWSIYNVSTRDNLQGGKTIFGTTTGPQQTFGAGTPEGNITAPVGSTYMRTDGGAGTAFYVKESGTGNTGWVGK